MIKTDVLILGGGLAGLSTAYHLNRLGIDSLVLEKADEVGGVAGSYKLPTKNGVFTFDWTGHLLHLHDPYGKRLITGLLKGNLASHERNAAIFSHGIHTRYPFQANTFGLPADVVDDCVHGFLKTVHRPGRLTPNPSFKDWCLHQFGEGISRHFMLPYNRKLWQTPLSEMTTEWQGRFIPKPKAAEVLLGALSDQRKFFGYNAKFLYPKTGGIQVLPDAFRASLKEGQVRTRSEAVFVDLRNRRVKTRIDNKSVSGRQTPTRYGFEWIKFKRLVNTMPLVDFLDLNDDLAPDIRRARQKLRYNTIYSLHVGVRRPNISQRHWIYYPESKFPFYRVGFYHNFSQQSVPPGCSSMYVEVARPSGIHVDLPSLKEDIRVGLRACGLMKSSDRVDWMMWNVIRCGYVVYDFNRTPAVNAIFPYLRKRGVESIGRYGAWKYSFMEETILDGRACARRLAGLAESPGPSRAPAELQPLK